MRCTRHYRLGTTPDRSRSDPKPPRIHALRTRSAPCCHPPVPTTTGRGKEEPVPRRPPHPRAVLAHESRPEAAPLSEEKNLAAVGAGRALPGRALS